MPSPPQPHLTSDRLTAAEAAPTATGLNARQRAAVLVATIGASSMAFIDGSVVHIALPAIQTDLGADFATLQWIVNVYALLLGALVLVGGAYGDRFGRRLIFLLGTAVFVAASVLCGVAPGGTTLIAARALQGVGAALMVPQSLAIIAASFPPATRGRAIGTWAAAAGLTTALGPPLGGLLVDLGSWRATFLINLPIGIVVLWLGFALVPESRNDKAHRADLAGGLLAALALGGLSIALIHVADLGWHDPIVIGGAVTAIIGLPLFIWHERRLGDDAMMPLVLFRDSVFFRVNLLTVLLYGALGGVLFVVPYTLIGLWGYTATQAGLALLPMALTIGILSRPFGSLGDRIGTRLPMIVGPAIVAMAFVWLATTRGAGDYFVGVLGPALGIGLGMAIVISPLTTTVMNALGDAYSGTASGINNAAARVAGLLAVAISGALMVALYPQVLGALVQDAGLPETVRSAALATSHRLLDAPIPAEAPGLGDLMNRAYADSLTWVLLFNAVLAALSAVLAIGLPRGVGRRDSRAMEPHAKLGADPVRTDGAE